MKKILVVLAVLATCGSQVTSDKYDHHYIPGDTLPCYASKVGPLNDTRETYSYLDIPFCSDDVRVKEKTLGQILNGDHLVAFAYRLKFRLATQADIACRKRLKREQVSEFRTAISRGFYFQMYCDDLPLQELIGFVDNSSVDPKYFIYNHIHFDVYYNKERVVEINTRTEDQAVELIEGSEPEVQFMYSVAWKKTDAPFEKRMEKYSGHHVSSQWFGIMSSCVTLVVLICFLVSLHKKVLHLQNDFIKDEESCEEEKGWKYLHSDVFRFPNHKSLFSAALGSGTQFLTIAILVLILGLSGAFYPYNRSDMLTALVVMCCVTSFIAGYVATAFYCMLGGTICVKNLLLTGSLFGGSMLTLFCFLSTIAISYRPISPLSFDQVMVMVFYWLLASLPLVAVGGVWGNLLKSEFQAPCRTSKCPREIPRLPWYRATLPQMAMAGIFPFSVIFTNLEYMFHNNHWDQRIHPTYGVLLAVFIILVLVTALVTIAFTYSQLSAGDHQWWWRSFICAGSTGLYIYCYGFYYYYTASDISGFLYTFSFFGSMAAISFSFFLMLGTVGFLASLIFVLHIYTSIRFD